ncbi:DUF3801 domain-containing protein [Butyrivibrio sp. XPD2002]|uniref:DUF3801 domain-containing protein n=1 Tax=Butyrivibrio sp. XPD2002 TaxID=1280665 RepID=UPI0009DB81BB|nr:DUF3801 domain-containing protein [Butyrivibrio sp. XPD2002]
MREEDARIFTKTASRKGIHLAVRVTNSITDKTGRITAIGIGKALKMYENRTRVFKGNNALKDFLKFDSKNRGPVGRIDVSSSDFKEFGDICKKNGVDFAIVKDHFDENKVHFFFSGKNAEVMSHLFEDYARNKFQQDLKEDCFGEEKEKGIDKELSEKSLAAGKERRQEEAKKKAGEKDKNIKQMDDIKKEDKEPSLNGRTVSDIISGFEEREQELER